MGKIIKISDYLARRSKNITGQIMLPNILSKGNTIEVMIEQRIISLNKSASDKNINFKKLSSEEELAFLETLSKRMKND